MVMNQIKQYLVKNSSSKLLKINQQKTEIMGRANLYKSSQKQLINSLSSIIIKQKLKQKSQKQKEELLQRADLFQLQILSRLQTFIAQKYSGIIRTQIERGFRLIIEPQFFADSFFVKNPERVETILFIMSLCLLVLSLIHI